MTTLVTILATIALLAILSWQGVELARARRAIQDAGDIGKLLTANAPSTDPQLVERIEACERRIAAGLIDLQKVYRKTAQERRRIEAGLGDDYEEVDDGPEGVEAINALRASLRQGQPNGPATPQPGRRTVLVRRNHE